jgi:hypothetical protein
MGEVETFRRMCPNHMVIDGLKKTKEVWSLDKPENSGLTDVEQVSF